MNAANAHMYDKHSNNCKGHCRAQRCAMVSHFDDEYEREKSNIKAYEDGWDRWDGPVWPWRWTNHPEGAKFEEEYGGCCNEPERVEEAGSKVVEESHPKVERPALDTRRSSSSGISTTSSLWQAGTCRSCGKKGALEHHL